MLKFCFSKYFGRDPPRHPIWNARLGFLYSTNINQMLFGENLSYVNFVVFLYVSFAIFYVCIGLKIL